MKNIDNYRSLILQQYKVAKGRNVPELESLLNDNRPKNYDFSPMALERAKRIEVSVPNDFHFVGEKFTAVNHFSFKDGLLRFGRFEGKIIALYIKEFSSYHTLLTGEKGVNYVIVEYDMTTQYGDVVEGMTRSPMGSEAEKMLLQLTQYIYRNSPLSYFD